MDIYDIIYICRAGTNIVLGWYVIAAINCLLFEYKLDNITWLKKSK